MTIIGLQKKRKNFIGNIQPDKLRTQLKSLKRASYISILLCALSALFVLAIQKRLPPEVPLFYGLAEGEQQLSSSIWLIIPSLTSLGIILLNGIISFFWKKDFLRETLTLTSLAVAILSTITTLKIILLVGSF